MMLFEKALIAALLRRLAASNTEFENTPGKPVDLTEFLPDKMTRHSFVYGFDYWKHPGRGSLTEAQLSELWEQITLPLSDLLDYLEHKLDVSDARTPFEPPTVEQVAWVFEKVCANSASFGTFRDMIYGEMGFDESAYGTLCTAGGIEINNAMMRDDDPADRPNAGKPDAS